MADPLAPPFAYFGGKTMLAERIAATFPPHGHYVEPYGGSLAVLLAKPPSPMETVNDLDGDLMVFWRVLRDRPAELARVCALTPHSRAEWEACKDLEVPDEVERARRVWTRLVQGRAGRMVHDDVRTAVEWWRGESRPGVDLVCGGFPCQPVSVAGRQLAQQDERWLWPAFAGVVRELRPRWVLLENVPGLLGRGAGDVLGDLATAGYDAEWGCVSAADVGAWHLRRRWFAVAYPNSEPGRLQPVPEPGSSGAAVAGDDGQARSVADSDGQGQLQPSGVPVEWRGRPGDGGVPVADADRPRSPRRPGEAGGRPGPARRLEPQRLGSRLSWDRPITSGYWASEPDVGRVAHGVPSRVDRLRGLGNAVVPQVSEYIGRLILSSGRAA